MRDDPGARNISDPAVFLRGFYRMAEAYPEQSVRGGTQTERNRLLHHNPLIVQLREAVVQAVRNWRDGLPDDAGPDHAGELALGMPPPELGLGLEPTQYIKPKPGRLALFPSTTWHGTVPFAGEERLTVAFDVASASKTTGSIT